MKIKGNLINFIFITNLALIGLGILYAGLSIRTPLWATIIIMSIFIWLFSIIIWDASSIRIIKEKRRCC